MDKTIGDIMEETGKNLCLGCGMDRAVERDVFGNDKLFTPHTHYPVFPCDKQYYKNGVCTETEKPSGRIHPCPVEHGDKCLIEGEE